MCYVVESPPLLHNLPQPFVVWRNRIFFGEEGIHKNMRICETNRIGFSMKTGVNLLKWNWMRSAGVKISIRFVWNENTDVHGRAWTEWTKWTERTKHGSMKNWTASPAILRDYLVRVRKLESIFFPSSVKIDSGWNWTPQMGCVLWRMPMISPSGLVSAVISRVSGMVSRLMRSE